MSEYAARSRPFVPALDELIGHEFKVLDRGFVRVIDYMGNDAAIVQAARVSYGAGTKTPSDDVALIRYLMRARHTSPFECCELKLHVKAPIFVARQWVRHRTANWSEYSARYSEVVAEESYVPSEDDVREQSATNKQGRGKQIRDAAAAIEAMEQASDEAYGVYRWLKDDLKVARELARAVLPLSTYTEWYWKIDLHNLLHFLTLRCDSHAQLEIRRYADQIADIVKLWVPATYQAWVDYRRDAVTLSGPALCALNWSDDERAAVRGMIEGAEGLSAREKADVVKALRVESDDLFDSLDPARAASKGIYVHLMEKESEG